MTDADLRRLRELEGIQTGPIGQIGSSETVSEAEPIAQPQPISEQGDSQTSPPKPIATRAWRRWLFVSASAVVLVAVGLWIGSVVAGGGVAGAGTGSAIPEFTTAQTDEDLLPMKFLDGDDSIDPDSVRFVAVLDGYYIALARPTGYDGICVLSFRTDGPDRTADSVGCSESFGSGGGLSVAISEKINVVVGETAVEGEPVRLSESVTAYRH
ncbi:hypothetical protein [uncultured Microbacterium sp.]|uniref:hypothetical protein n=1 Tax=uncultured Microbacterium sp. TaxID=191216 RepID=UPI0035C99B20